MQTYSVLFDNVMRYIWGDNDPPQDFIVRAVADKVRGTSRINPENALDVLDGMASIVSNVHVRAADDNDSIAIFTVQFVDNSSILIEAHHGIGSSVEVLR